MAAAAHVPVEPGRSAVAMARWQVLRPHLEDGVPLARAAREAGVAQRTAAHWLTRFRADGMAGLERTTRADAGSRRTRAELVAIIEGLALSPPRPSAATITRKAAIAAAAHGWAAPAYATVHQIVTALDPHLLTLAHEGPGGLRDRYELVHRRAAQRPNEIWQADHTQLDVLVLDQRGAPVRPWLTLVLDDCSRAVCGYTLFLGAPSALNLSLAMRQAVLVKTDPTWVVHGLPEVLYADHGSDFTSTHLRQVCADLHVRLIHSAVARPQGRGKIERLFGTITTELLPMLPGHLVRGHPQPAASITLAELDEAMATWLAGYHQRVHCETGLAPSAAWIGQGWMTRTLEESGDLDALLVMVATPRMVHRDGVRFQGLRFTHPTLAPYVGEEVAIRYDPRDVTEVRVYHRDAFVCRAISAAHATEAITLKDLQAARTAHRRALRAQLITRRAAVAEFLPSHGHRPAGTAASAAAAAADAPPPAKPRLAVYEEDLP